MERKKGINGLPSYFKIIGAAVAVLALLVPVFLKLLDISLEEGEKEWAKTISFDIMKIGLVLVILARDKIEDERTVHVRLFCAMLAFLFGVILSILSPYIDLIFNIERELTVNKVIFTMLGFYIIMYYIQKRKM